MDGSPNVTSGPVPSRPPTRRGRATRDAIVAAARERFLADGYLNVTVPGIAATANRSSASFYTYFESKADLLQILAGEAIDDLEAQLAVDVADQPVAERSASDLVARVTSTIWSAYRDHLPLFLSVFQTAMKDLELQPWSRLRSVLIGVIEEVDQRLVVAGADPLPDQRTSARSLASMFENTCFLWLAEADEPPGHQLSDDEAVRTLAGMWMASMQEPR